MKNLNFWGVSLLLVMMAVSGTAQNPIIQTKYTADPAPMVYNDTVFLYTTHDEDDAEGFKMLDWLLYTSTDMVNWTPAMTTRMMATSAMPTAPVTFFTKR